MTNVVAKHQLTAPAILLYATLGNALSRPAPNLQIATKRQAILAITDHALLRLVLLILNAQEHLFAQGQYQEALVVLNHQLTAEIQPFAN
jgi:hypothetical protein